MIKRISLLIFLFFLFFQGVRGAQTIKVNALIEEALQNNPALKALEQNRKSAQSAVKPAGALPDPMLEMSIMSVPVDTFSLTQEKMTQKVLSLKQEIPFPTKLKSAQKIAELEAQLANSQVRIFEEQLKFDVKKNFYELANLEETLIVTQSNIATLTNLAKTATSLYSVGKSAQWDVFSAQVETIKLNQQSLVLSQKITSVKAKLAMLLGRDNFEIEGETEVAWTPLFEGELEKFNNAALENNPQLEYIEIMLKKAQESARLAEKWKLPDFSITLSYGQRGKVEMNGMSENLPDFLSAMVGISVPLYARRKQIPLTVSAQAQVNAIKLALENEKLRILSDIKSLTERIKQRDKTEELYRTGIIPQARSTLQSALASYQVSKVDFLILLSSQLDLMNFELEYFSVRIEREVDIAELEMLMGVSLSEVFQR